MRHHDHLLHIQNELDPSYYTEDDLQGLPFKRIGKNVRIARGSTIVGMTNISIGDNVRIDGFCTLLAIGEAGNLQIGSNVHIGAYCYLNAADGINMEDFSGLSQGVRMYSRTDDYTGNYLTNPTVPGTYTRITAGTVHLMRHVIVGSGTVILPKVTIGEGSAVGAQSLVTKSLEEWGVYFGSPVQRIKSRSKGLLELEAKYLQER